MSTIREDSIKVLYIHIFLDSVTKLLHIYAKIEGSTYICMCVHLMSYINLHEGSINTHNYDLYFEKKSIDENKKYTLKYLYTLRFII